MYDRKKKHSNANLRICKQSKARNVSSSNFVLSDRIENFIFSGIAAVIRFLENICIRGHGSPPLPPPPRRYDRDRLVRNGTHTP